MQIDCTLRSEGALTIDHSFYLDSSTHKKPLPFLIRDFTIFFLELFLFGIKVSGMRLGSVWDRIA